MSIADIFSEARDKCWSCLTHMGDSSNWMGMAIYLVRVHCLNHHAPTDIRWNRKTRAAMQCTSWQWRFAVAHCRSTCILWHWIMHVFHQRPLYTRHRQWCTIHWWVAWMDTACCHLFLVRAATAAATACNDTGRMDDRRLMTSFGLNDKISLILDDVIHGVPWTQTTANRTNRFQSIHQYTEVQHSSTVKHLIILHLRLVCF